MRNRIPIGPVCWRLCACSEALASLGASAASYRLSKDVVVVPVIEAKLELREVERQVFLADVMVRPDHAAFEQAPERFDVVRVDFAAHVLARAVADDFVWKEMSQIAVSAPFIRCDQGDFLRYGCLDKAAQRIGGSVFDDLANDVALAGDRADNGRFASMGRATAAILLAVLPMPVFLLAADVGFVNFDDPHELFELWVFHRGSQPMAHVPSGLVCAAPNLALNLERTDTLFAVQDLPENLEPRLEWVLCILEDRPANDAEAVVFAGLAEPVERSRMQLVNAGIAAMRATDNAVSPAVFQHELLAGIVSRKGFHQLAERHHV
jgi:hypothetical protein